MRRTIILMIALVCIAGAAQAFDIVTDADTISFKLNDWDSAGIKAGEVDSFSVHVEGPAGDSIKAEKAVMTWTANVYTGTNWKVSKRSFSTKAYDTVYSAWALVSTIVTAGRYGPYTVTASVYSDHAKAKIWTPKVFEFRYVAKNLSWALKAATDSNLRPTTTGRTLDVSTGGEAGLDWANVGTPGSTVSLSATTVATVTTATTATNVTTVNGLAANTITAASIAVDANQEIDSGVWHSRVDTITPDSSAGKVLYKNKTIKDTSSTFVNATISSRSTLAAADNIGINWGDISNVTSTNSFTNTTVGTVTNVSQIGGTAQTGINLGTYLPAIFDTLLLVNGNRQGCKARWFRNADVDSLRIFSRDGTTLLQTSKFYHTGGTPGAAPNDTSKTTTGP